MATDADWEQQYDALTNLRVLNKFHSALMAEVIREDNGQWLAGFVAAQVKNLRSHNSRNAMELFYELFTHAG